MHWLLPCALAHLVVAQDLKQTTLRRAAHWTDVHVDPLYKAGSDWHSEYCDDGKGDAGVFGHAEGNCATPQSLYEGAVQFLAMEGVDTVLFTGDFTQAGLTSMPQLLDTISYDIAQLRAKVPQARIFSAVGNHDAYPGDVFPHPFPALYERLVEVWGTDLQETAKQQLKEGGYYSTDAGNGLQVISLNTMYLCTLNPLVKNKSSAEYRQGFIQMDWFASELAAAEERKAHVWVLAHVPFDDGFVPEHVARYQQLMEQYAHVVSGQFFGHDHMDFFKLTRSCNGSSCNGAPTGTIFVGPSLTEGFPPENPGVRMYLYDDNHTVHDALTWRVNLSKANLNRKLEFEYEYSMKEAYNLTDLSPESMGGLVERLNTSQELFDRFYHYYYRGYDGPSAKPCDAACQRSLVCTCAFSDVEDVRSCVGSHGVDLHSAIYCYQHGAAVAAGDPICAVRALPLRDQWSVVV